MHPLWRTAKRKVKVSKLPIGSQFVDRSGQTGTLLGRDETAVQRYRVALDGRGTTYVSGELAVAILEVAP